MNDDGKIYKKLRTTKWCCIPSTNDVDVTNDYVKKGEAQLSDVSLVKLKNLVNKDNKDDIEFDDLTKEDKKRLIEDAVLQSGVDGGEITWKEFLQSVNTGINYLKREYLKTQPKFAYTWTYYDSKEHLASLKANTMPDDIDTIRDKNGTEISEDKLTEQVIANIKKAVQDKDNDNKAYVDLYDAKDNKLVNDTNYDLSKINDYKVALVIPNALLGTE
ncbi:MAG: hypothetical protein IJT15_01610 [Rickettsiales bacterium]|nr:hypothetical protein [Rickettsiales bacterium]